ncbi:urease accessory protein UreF [Rhodobacteraceae bacterium HSP-20]|uniref:Urease accessory protein UreF n=1 Tax=Paragemmobacter amnigenus TaxID=2852097 RepID=A0ABS6IYF3_9RHOB|nr:urease accessory UreF family protein [Rhodobacter amnigenus]MBU9696544.1 urease accessory protein UreF [Rhodobacter amnigenus]MBV4387771.1 urease accessory protein UreF [Rhodobacter amnigenus]
MTAALMTLVQWLSPAFPTGGFAYSHGMEQVISDGGIRSGADLEAWLADVLRFGAGRQDAILLAAALEPGADHAALAELCVALQPSAERLREVAEQGAAFARTVAALTGRAVVERPLPVAVGEAAAGLGLERAQVVALYLHAFASNLVSVAVRFVPLGQNDGQVALARLHPLIARLAEEAVSLGVEDIGSAALGADLAAMRHEGLDVRIFKT